MDKFYEFAVCEDANHTEFLVLVPLGTAVAGMAVLVDGELFDVVDVIPACMDEENAKKFHEVSGDTLVPDAIYNVVWKKEADQNA